MLLNNCSKGPIVTDIVKGIYDSKEINKKTKSKKVKVVTGDTLASISKKYKVTKKELIRFNKIKYPYILKPGNFIKIPVPKIYKIKKGDTLYKIARCSSTNISEIKNKNIKINEKKLIVGSVINLPYYSINKCKQKNKVVKKNNIKKKPIKSKEIFIWPVEGSIITYFGKQKGGRKNDGINIMSVKGNPVRAAMSGKVIYRGNELLAWGNLIIIKHKNNWTTAYAHLDKLLVKKGEIIKTGEIIASVGETGNVDKSQLHFQVRKHSKPLDPIKFLKKP
ncbi:M23 family metallopeptidase [Alphaproteobacteria bacterium]|nr:M23 family metallopeptidase [Alphaproteobacteria bacterium]